MDDAMVAWAAGLFEGEGCFSAYRSGPKGPQGRRYAYLSAAITMTDEEPLLRFAEIVGVGRVFPFNPPSLRLRGHSPAYRWNVKGEKAIVVYELLRPWLCARRCEQVRSALAEQAALVQLREALV